MLKEKGPKPWETQVLIDCDGVLAELIIPAEFFAGDRNRPELKPLDEPNWAYAMNPVKGSRELIDSIEEMGLETTVLTSPWDTSMTWDWDRKRWLLQIYGIDKYHVIFAKQKWLVGGLTLIEDKAENANWWSEQHNRPSILINQYWNVEEELDPRVIRVDNLEEATAAVRSLHAWHHCRSKR